MQNARDLFVFFKQLLTIANNYIQLQTIAVKVLTKIIATQLGIRGCVLLLRQAAEALSQDFGAFHDVDKSFWVDAVEHRAQFYHVGAVECDIYHLALISFVEATAGDACAATLEVVDDEVAHGFGVVGDDEHGLIALHAVNHEVDYLAFDEDDDN